LLKRKKGIGIYVRGGSGFLPRRKGKEKKRDEKLHLSCKKRGGIRSRLVRAITWEEKSGSLGKKSSPSGKRETKGGETRRKKEKKKGTNWLEPDRRRRG